MLLEGVTMKSIRCVFCFRQEHVPQVEGGPIEKIEKYDILKESTSISSILFYGKHIISSIVHHERSFITKIVP
jgi:L-lysine 2,3-aminomutase